MLISTFFSYLLFVSLCYTLELFSLILQLISLCLSHIELLLNLSIQFFIKYTIFNLHDFLFHGWYIVSHLIPKPFPAGLTGYLFLGVCSVPCHWCMKILRCMLMIVFDDPCSPVYKYYFYLLWSVSCHHGKGVGQSIQ